MIVNIIKPELALDFIFSGKSLFTCLNTKSGNRFTFKVSKHKKSEIYFVKVLTNPDIYEFIGSIYKDGNFSHSNKSRISRESQSVKVFSYIINHLKSNTLPEYIEIWHNGKCGMCGKTLTVPQSIETGYGPNCSRRLKLNK